MDYPLVIKFLFLKTLTLNIYSHSAVGIPYLVRVFAENGAGNGSFCTIIDFGDEACKS